MYEISVDDFQKWKSDPVTKSFFMAATDRVNDVKEMLTTSAGLDSGQDNFYRGFIFAYNEIAEFKVEE
jgi:hypothetical protein